MLSGLKEGAAEFLGPILDNVQKVLIHHELDYSELTISFSQSKQQTFDQRIGSGKYQLYGIFIPKTFKVRYTMSDKGVLTVVHQRPLFHPMRLYIDIPGPDAVDFNKLVFDAESGKMQLEIGVFDGMVNLVANADIEKKSAKIDIAQSLVKNLKVLFLGLALYP
jgi:hypothetical protein